MLDLIVTKLKELQKEFYYNPNRVILSFLREQFSIPLPLSPSNFACYYEQRRAFLAIQQRITTYNPPQQTCGLYLDQFLAKCRPYLSMQHYFIICKKIAAAVLEIHNTQHGMLKLVHNQLTLENIFIYFDAQQSTLYSANIYILPSAVPTIELTAASDTYALGIVLAQVFGFALTPAAPSAAAAAPITHSHRQIIGSGSVNEDRLSRADIQRNFNEGLLNVDPAKRSDTREILTFLTTNLTTTWGPDDPIFIPMLPYDSKHSFVSMTPRGLYPPVYSRPFPMAPEPVYHSHWSPPVPESEFVRATRIRIGDLHLLGSTSAPLPPTGTAQAELHPNSAPPTPQSPPRRSPTQSMASTTPLVKEEEKRGIFRRLFK